MVNTLMPTIVAILRRSSLLIGATLFLSAATILSQDESFGQSYGPLCLLSIGMTLVSGDVRHLFAPLPCGFVCTMTGMYKYIPA